VDTANHHLCSTGLKSCIGVVEVGKRHASDIATLNSKEIKLVATAIIELRLSEGIS